MSFVEMMKYASFMGGGGTGGGGDVTEYIQLCEGSLTDFVAKKEMHSMADYLFCTSTALKTVDLSAYSGHVAGYAFANATNLETVILPNWSNNQIGDTTMPTFWNRAFQNCKSLKKIDTPYPFVVASGSPAVFQGCTSLESATFPLGRFINSGSCFSGCTALGKIDINAGTFPGNMFQDCTALLTLVIRAEFVSTLANVTAFSGTPFASGGTGGTVYVPAALIEQYKTATNWSTLYAAGTCNFVAIEGSEYE